MTLDEARDSIESLKKQGWSDDDILGAFYKMFQDGKLNIDELAALVDILGYELTDKFLKMSPEDQKTRGYED